MKDQRQLWDSAHLDGEIAHYSSTPTDFANEVLKIIKPHTKILELGCGVGNDSVAFANSGYQIPATDFSEVAIGKNVERFKDFPNLTFQVLDMNQPFKFLDNEFGLVYARLSLHYFTDQTTRRIFKEICRILKPEGFLCFICKSIDDPLFGKGKEIEKNMFEFEGHIRHFFSKEYAESLLRDAFKIESIESGDEKFYGNDSAYVKVVTQVIK